MCNSMLMLLREIENCRQEMITLSDKHPLTSDVVIRVSMRLDELINEYQNRMMTRAS